ncbi:MULTISPECIES: LytTR family DNA-binding domain-containing protein [Leuconostoc]|uniref:Sensory transduction protein LytR n=1 Tax=Leuconostoc suionicum TaxID=1511761 RepID=A0A2N9KA39_9LACO|nr:MULTISPECIES: LytTR family DNA-binding domain-containing protein [Leuconostoc]MBE4728005.1 LytTR family transcriptional regulator [Leuconostoc suionicum]MCT4401507.1 LytTR family transcriptional regulator [Leuconostoc suionicum]MDI6497824.1 LytTR family DNA-binding domain-containing protein [Leuconostoc suionicum]MDI6499896.1 LytTR family DNA-binding domain-containing protein [Leuconostoc suionicum]MDI6501955.1 LytTR family DNA-binding domain-containing protein [Leuconostoc suionicum]
MEISINIDDKLKDIQVVISGSDIEQLADIAQYLKSRNTPSRQIAIKTADNIRVVDKEDIILVESYGNDLTFTLKNNHKITTRKTLKRFLEENQKSDFVQISKSEVMNLSYLSKMESAFSGNYYAFLTNQSRVTVSRRFIKGILKRLEGSAEDEAF